MKTHNFKFNPNLLAVELKTTVINSSYHIQKTPKGTLLKDDVEQKFISDKYIFLGKLTDLIEDDVIDLIDFDFASDNNESKFYTDYRNEDDSFTTALESLMSGIESEVYWENPFMKPSDKDIVWFHNQINGDFSERYTFIFDWHEAELRTFDKNRTIIFKKV